MLKSGFYNALDIGGEYDRLYSADEYTNFYAAFLRDGVRRSGADDLKCTANGLNVDVNIGFAICGAKWIHNDTITTVEGSTPPVGDFSRVDGVFIHVDTNEATRAASLIYRTGTAASDPVPPAKDTTAGVYELMICSVLVTPNATAVTVTDTRGDSEFCGWITTPVGYDDYFVSLDSAFDDWFEDTQADFAAWYQNAKDTLASTTLFKQYTWTYTTEATTTTSVTFNIPQYDSTGVDIIDVYVNGMREAVGVDYTLSGSTITFNIAKIAGTQILVVCYKSIDGAGLGSVSEEVTELQNEVAAIQTATLGDYVCNGLTDNEGIVTLARELKAETGAGGSVRINVYGTFGASNPIATDASKALFYFGDWSGATPVDDWGDVKLILDFANCSLIDLDGQTLEGISTSLPMFLTHDGQIQIENLNLKCINVGSIFTNSPALACFHSRIIHGGRNNQINAQIANAGLFEDCLLSVIGGNVFNSDSLVDGDSMLRITNCECYAYAVDGVASFVPIGYVIHGSNTANAPVFTEKLSCPTVAKSGMTQTGAILDEYITNAHAVYSGTITTLTITQTSQSVWGTITASVPIYKSII